MAFPLEEEIIKQYKFMLTFEYGTPDKRKQWIKIILSDKCVDKSIKIRDRLLDEVLEKNSLWAPVIEHFSSDMGHFHSRPDEIKIHYIANKFWKELMMFLCREEKKEKERCATKIQRWWRKVV